MLSPVFLRRDSAPPGPPRSSPSCRCPSSWQSRGSRSRLQSDRRAAAPPSDPGAAAARTDPAPPSGTSCAAGRAARRAGAVIDRIEERLPLVPAFDLLEIEDGVRVVDDRDGLGLPRARCIHSDGALRNSVTTAQTRIRSRVGRAWSQPSAPGDVGVRVQTEVAPPCIEPRSLQFALVDHSRRRESIIDVGGYGFASGAAQACRWSAASDTSIRSSPSG